MKKMKYPFFTVLFVLFLSGFAFAQAVGDYRSAANGNWSAAATWERFDGSSWVAASNPPVGFGILITVDGTDTVRVDMAVTITDQILRVTDNALVEVTTGSLDVTFNGVYDHARDGGAIPLANWNTGGTLVLSGTVQDAPANRNQNFWHVRFNTPNLGRNRDMGWNGNTINGNVHMVNSGLYRWQMTSAAANDTAEFTIMQGIQVSDGTLAVQGTSNANTTFIVHVYDDVIVGGGNFSLARGSQGSGSGTTTMYLHDGDLTISNATIQNSNPTPGNAKFVFSKNDTQVVNFTNVTYGGGGINFEVSDSSTMQVVNYMTINGLLVNKGNIDVAGYLTFADGSVYEHARDAGSIPTATWEAGSTLLMTGTVQDAPSNRVQNFYNVTFNTPNLGRNRDMSWTGNTISGDVRVINSGANRWYLTSAAAGASASVTIMGDVILEAGALSAQGTSNANTTIIVNHYGNINVTGGNFSIARGSQGSGTGTTTWYLHSGNFAMANATTQNSNPTPGNAKFIFANRGNVQNLTLSNVTFGGGGLPIQVDSLVTINMDTNVVGGADIFNLSPTATITSTHPNGLNGNLTTTGPVALSKQANYTFNGTLAQVPGALLPDSVAVLTVTNPAGVTFNDTLTCTNLAVTTGAVMQIDTAGNVTANSGTVAGTVVNKGALSNVTPLVFENASVYEHARDAGSVPTATWNEGSTFLLTGTVQDAPSNRVQNFYNVTFNTPNLGRNRDMGWNGNTIGGDIRVINTGVNRWYLTSAAAGAGTMFIIVGDVIVEGGSFAAQGTSNANTFFSISQYGNIIVTGGNFSIARGSQGSGAGITSWFLYNGDFSMSNATTQNSNPLAGNAKFFFEKRGGIQKLTLSNVTFGGGGLSIYVDSLVTLDMDTTVIGGDGFFGTITSATLMSAHPNGLDGNLQTSGTILLSQQVNFTFNGNLPQVPGMLLPDSIGVLTVANPAGVTFNDTLTCTDLAVTTGAVMQIDTAGNVATNSGTIAGTVINKGALSNVTPLVFESTSVYEHARNAGNMPSGVWNEGSTLLMTGTFDTAPGNRNQNYYNITFNSPNLASNRDMGLNDVTIAGDIKVENTGLARWYLTSALANDTSIVTLMGDVIVQNGAFSAQGTSNAYTVFEVHHYGDVLTTGGNFSVCRGSQGSGTGSTRWFMHTGNFSLADATTQNSNSANAWFVFDSDTVQNITLSNVTYGGGGLAIEVAAGTTLDFGVSELGGAGLFILNAGATLATAHTGGLDSTLQNTGKDSISDGANYVFNGTAAQVTSTHLPMIVNDLTIDNLAGVVLSQATTINGVLHLKAGVFDNTIPFTLGPNGSISYEGGSLLIPTSVDISQLSELPAKFAMFQNYPNPFNPSTTIRFDLPKQANVILKVYDIMGREVAELLNDKVEAGSYSVVWDARAYASGIYYYRITAGDFVSVKKLVVMK